MNINSQLSQHKSREQEIISMLRRNDETAISILYKFYGPNLFGAISSIVKENQLAEEVLQDVFVKIWKNREKFDEQKGRLFTWMINIARRTAIDATKTRVFKDNNRTSNIGDIVSNNGAFSISDVTTDSGLAKVVDSLDEKYQKIIYYTYYLGYTQREIEKELNIPLGTVKSRTRIAIKMLREKLGQEFSLGLLGLLIYLYIMNLFT